MKKFRLIFLIVFIIFIIGFILVKFNHTSDKELLGVWKLDNNTKYEFFKRGKGQLIIPDGIHKFTYKIEDDILYFEFEEKTTIDTSYKYQIKDNKLELIKMNNKKEKFVLNKENL